MLTAGLEKGNIRPNSKKNDEQSLFIGFIIISAIIDLKVLFISGLLIEVITIIARFMFKQSSKKTYISLMMGKRLKYFIHLHHGITGIIICAVTYILGQSLLFNIGLGMIFSDLAHHVLVLWPLTGSPEFHLMWRCRRSR